MSYKRHFVIEKSPSEKRVRTIQIFDEDVPSLAITALTVTAIDESNGSDATATVVDSGGTSFSGDIAQARFKAGTNGKAYKVTYSMELNDGDRWDIDGTLIVGNS